MKLKIQNAGLIKSVLCLFTFAVLTGFVLWNLARASEAGLNFTEHPSVSFGMARGEIARLNVVNPDARERKTFVLRFLDENGGVLKTVRTVVEPKHSFGLLLPASEAGGAVRTQIRAEVLMQGDLSNRLLGNVEIFDEVTGRTSFSLLLSVRDFDPQPEPPAPQ
jgi:hypothetical protein